MKKSIIIFIAIILSIPFINVSAFADSASISVSKSTVEPGSQVTVTVNYSSNLSLFTAAGTLSYNSSVLQYVSGGSAASGSNVSLYKDLNGEQSASFSIVFNAIAEGSSSLSVHMDGSDGNTKGSADSGAVVTVAKPAPSSNANLSSLKVDGVVLSPAFSQNTTTYSGSVPNRVDSVSIRATAAVSNSSIIGIGDKKLNEGDNSFTITVTAPSGAKKTYIVNIRRRLPDEFTTEELLTVTVGDEQKKICSDISALPVINGFKQNTTLYKDISVGVLKDSAEKYELYYLTDLNGENPKLYTLNSDGQFELLPLMDYTDKTLIIEDSQTPALIPDGYKEKAFEINGKSFKAFGFDNSKMDDFYILYCFDGENREYYTLDSLTGIIQRFPMFESLLTAKPKPVAKEKTSLTKQFKNLPLLFKSITIFSLIALIAVIVLLILLILSKKHSNVIDMVYDDSDNDSGFSLNNFNTDLSNKYLDDDK